MELEGKREEKVMPGSFVLEMEGGDNEAFDTVLVSL